jgi:deoxyribodipyrimidine photolyase-related protein
MPYYCQSCAYDVRLRTGPTACPFNALYWDFVARNRSRFANNPRMGQMVRAYEACPSSKSPQSRKVRRPS